MIRWTTLLLVGVSAGGCTLSDYSRQADRSAYATIASARQNALGGGAPFDVDYRPFAPPEGQAGEPIRIGDKSLPVGGGKPVTITLSEALRVAARNSRSFQTRKEQLYTQGLALANERRSWNWPQLGGTASADGDWSRTEDAGGTTKSSAAAVGPTLTQRLAGGGVLVVAATLDFATDFLGSSGTSVGSLLDANFTQPLLRGAWRGLAFEDLYRTERDFLFAVFDYERFTQTFAADIVTNYYAVLQQRDQLENERSNIERLRQTLALTRVLVEGGQVSPIQQDQAEQNLLNAQIRFEQNQQSYRNTLDQFKLTLGLPMAANVAPDYPAELRRLNEAGPTAIGFEEAEAVAIALAVRPDVLTERSKVRDARRDVEITADDFLPQLDLELSISAPGTETQQPYRVRFHGHTRQAQLTFNYDLDQTDNRDAYRSAMIELAKTTRDLDQFEDNVRLAVRRSYRALLQSRHSYELQKRSVEIALRRRKLASLQQKEGEASARDVLEAEEALRSAQNGLTTALISYTTTRLEFLAGLGMIGVDEKGQIHERAKPFQFDRLRRRYPYVGAE